MTTLPTIIPALMIAGLCFWIVFSEEIPTALRHVILSVGCVDVLLSGIYDATGDHRLWSASLYLDMFGLLLAIYAIWRKHLIDDGGRE